MKCNKVPVSALLLGAAIAIAPFAWPGSATAAVQAASNGSDLSTVVIRGSNDAATPPSSGDDDPPVVLRGSPPSPPRPPVTYGCPAGYFYDPSNGCVVPGSAYEPYDNGYDYDYWPFWGFGGFDSGVRRHRFPHSFAHRASRGAVARFGHPALNGFGHGLAHIGGFGRR